MRGLELRPPRTHRGRGLFFFLWALRRDHVKGFPSECRANSPVGLPLLKSRPSMMWHPSTPTPHRAPPLLAAFGDVPESPFRDQGLCPLREIGPLAPDLKGEPAGYGDERKGRRGLFPPRRRECWWAADRRPRQSFSPIQTLPCSDTLLRRSPRRRRLRTFRFADRNRCGFSSRPGRAGIGRVFRCKPFPPAPPPPIL